MKAHKYCLDGLQKLYRLLVKKIENLFSYPSGNQGDTVGAEKVF